MTLDMAHWTYGAQIDHMSHDNRKGGFVHVKANSGHDSCHVTSGIAASSCCPKLRPTPPCHHFHQLSMLGVANGSSGHQPFRVATFLLSKPTSHHSFWYPLPHRRSWSICSHGSWGTSSTRTGANTKWSCAGKCHRSQRHEKHLCLQVP